MSSSDVRAPRVHRLGFRPLPALGKRTFVLQRPLRLAQAPEGEGRIQPQLTEEQKRKISDYFNNFLRREMARPCQCDWCTKNFGPV
jgi:hypothetical protein